MSENKTVVTIQGGGTNPAFNELKPLNIKDILSKSRFDKKNDKTVPTVQFVGEDGRMASLDKSSIGWIEVEGAKLRDFVAGRVELPSHGTLLSHTPVPSPKGDYSTHTVEWKGVKRSDFVIVKDEA